jgi:hypothetical protein
VAFDVKTHRKAYIPENQSIFSEVKQMVENLDLPSSRDMMEDILNYFFSGYIDEFKVVPNRLLLTYNEFHKMFRGWDSSNGGNVGGIMMDEYIYDEYGTRAIVFVEYIIVRDHDGSTKYYIREVSGIREKVEEDEKEEEE